MADDMTTTADLLDPEILGPMVQNVQYLIHQ